MRDDSRKWALLFLAIGGGTALGMVVQVIKDILYYPAPLLKFFCNQ